MTESHPGKSSGFIPSAHAQQRLLTNLSHPLTSFIGREQGIKAIERLLSTTRLLTLTGVGGIGKTRLALQVVSQLPPHFTDGIWVVDLATVADAQGVPQALIRALGMRKEPRRLLLTTLTEALRSKHMFLLLDNCEHLIDECAILTQTLLCACPGLSILVTSREILDIGGEQIWRVPPLSTPPVPSDPFSEHFSSWENVESIRAYEAVQLFIERAKAVRPDFDLTQENAVALAQICLQLEGIPLAIELAASRIQVLALKQIATRLNNCFDLLNLGSRLALPRQQTLRATLDWSYELLSEKERMLLRRLAIFVGNWTLEEAEMICCGSSDVSEHIATCEILGGVTQLVNKSLLIMEEDAQHMHYRLLETVRQYAWEKLEAAGEVMWMQRQHLNYFLALVQQAEPRFYTAEQLVWLQSLQQAYDNVRTAFEWTLKQGLWEQGLQLAAGLKPFWTLRGQDSEGYEWLEHIISLTKEVPPTESQAKALLALGSLGLCRVLKICQLDNLLVRHYLDSSLQMWRRWGNLQEIALALTYLGELALDDQEFVAARTLLEEGVALFRQIGHEWGEMRAVYALACIDFEQGDLQHAYALLEKTLTQARLFGERMMLGRTLNLLGEFRRFEGKFEDAERYYEEALHSFQELNNVILSAMVLGNRAQTALAQDNARQGLMLQLEALRLMYRHYADCSGGKPVSMGLISLAGIALALGEARLAAQLYGTANVLCQEDLLSLDQPDRAQFERDLCLLQQQLDQTTLETARAEGRMFSLIEAITLVESHFCSNQRDVSRISAPSGNANSSEGVSRFSAGLTEREAEVLHLLVQGLTNKQMAERLVLSPRTINIHVASIFSKFGVNSRSAATRFAFEHSLVTL